MKHWSFLALALIVLTVFTACPSSPEEPQGGGTGTLVLRISNPSVLPDGTSLKITLNNGKVVELSKSSNQTSILLAVGTYTYSITQKDAFTPESGPITITNGQTINVSFTYKATGTLKVTLTGAAINSEIKVKANSTSIGSVSSTKSLEKVLPVGTYLLSAEFKGYTFEFSPANAVIKANQTTEVTLKATKIEAGKGALVFNLDISNAKGFSDNGTINIFVDGTKVGTLTKGQQAYTHNVAPGDHTIKTEAEGLDSFIVDNIEEKVTVKAGESKTYTVAVCSKENAGTGGVNISDQIKGDVTVTITGLIDVYKKGEDINASATCKPAVSNATYEWHVGNTKVGSTATLNYNTSNITTNKFTLTCVVKIDGALYSSEIKDVRITQ